MRQTGPKPVSTNHAHRIVQKEFIMSYKRKGYRSASDWKPVYGNHRPKVLKVVDRTADEDYYESSTEYITIHLPKHQRKAVDEVIRYWFDTHYRCGCPGDCCGCWNYSTAPWTYLKNLGNGNYCFVKYGQKNI
jgi:hypothetical protein